MEKQKPPSTPPPDTPDLDQLLDEALDKTFPASDPVAIHLDPDRHAMPAEGDPARPRGKTKGS